MWKLWAPVSPGNDKLENSAPGLPFPLQVTTPMLYPTHLLSWGFRCLRNFPGCAWLLFSMPMATLQYFFRISALIIFEKNLQKCSHTLRQLSLEFSFHYILWSELWFHLWFCFSPAVPSLLSLNFHEFSIRCHTKYSFIKRITVRVKPTENG